MLRWNEARWLALLSIITILTNLSALFQHSKATLKFVYDIGCRSYNLQLGRIWNCNLAKYLKINGRFLYFLGVMSTDQMSWIITHPEAWCRITLDSFILELSMAKWTDNTVWPTVNDLVRKCVDNFDIWQVNVTRIKISV